MHPFTMQSNTNQRSRNVLANGREKKIKKKNSLSTVSVSTVYALITTASVKRANTRKGQVERNTVRPRGARRRTRARAKGQPYTHNAICRFCVTHTRGLCSQLT